MLALIASDDSTTATKLRHALVQLGCECPVSRVISFENVGRVLRESNWQPDLVCLVLPDDMDVSLVAVREARELMSGRLITVGRGDDAQRVLGAIHAGADDFLDETRDIHAQLAAAFERFESRGRQTAAAGRLIVVTSAAGGSGTSFVASNLAVLAAQHNPPCGLLDLDLRRGIQMALLDLKARHTIADLCRSLDSLDGNMLQRSLVEHASGVSVLAAPQRFTDQQQVTSEGVRKILQQMRALFPQMIVDLSDSLEAGPHSPLQAADLVIVVFRPDFPSVRSVRRTLNHWDESGIAADKVCLIANRCVKGGGIPIPKVESALRRTVTHCLPEDAHLAQLSTNCGTPVVLEAPASHLARSLRRVAGTAGLMESGEPAGVAESAIGTRLREWLASAIETVMSRSGLHLLSRTTG